MQKQFDSYFFTRNTICSLYIYYPRIVFFISMSNHIKLLLQWSMKV